MQAWRGSSWSPDHFSIATFDIKNAPGGTLLTFTQIGVPVEHYSDISKGWAGFYWKPMNAALAKTKMPAQRRKSR